MNDETKFALRKLVGSLAKPIAILLGFVALVLFLMNAVSNIGNK